MPRALSTQHVYYLNILHYTAFLSHLKEWTKQSQVYSFPGQLTLFRHKSRSFLPHLYGGHYIQKKDLKDAIVLHAAIQDDNCIPFVKKVISVQYLCLLFGISTWLALRISIVTKTGTPLRCECSTNREIQYWKMCPIDDECFLQRHLHVQYP